CPPWSARSPSYGDLVLRGERGPHGSKEGLDSLADLHEVARRAGETVAIEIAAPLSCAVIISKEARRETCRDGGINLCLTSLKGCGDRASQFRSVEGKLHGK